MVFSKDHFSLIRDNCAEEEHDLLANTTVEDVNENQKRQKRETLNNCRENNLFNK